MMGCPGEEVEDSKQKTMHTFLVSSYTTNQKTFKIHSGTQEPCYQLVEVLAKL